MKRVFATEKGTVVLDSVKDTLLYESPRNPPNTGSVYTRGTDLLVHTSRKGNVFFYLRHWSMWQGEETTLEPVSLEDASEFARSQVGDYWGFGDEEDVKLFEKYGIQLLEETA